VTSDGTFALIVIDKSLKVQTTIRFYYRRHWGISSQNSRAAAWMEKSRLRKHSTWDGLVILVHAFQDYQASLLTANEQEHKMEARQAAESPGKIIRRRSSYA
jgi:hypothetical protein